MATTKRMQKGAVAQAKQSGMPMAVKTPKVKAAPAKLPMPKMPKGAKGKC